MTINKNFMIKQRQKLEDFLKLQKHPNLKNKMNKNKL